MQCALDSKGNVEALVKFARQAFLTPVPNEPSFAALNAALERQCLARLQEASGRDPTPIGERLMADLAAFRSLPDGVFEACDMRPGRVSSTSLVRYRNVDYSVPTAHAYTTVLVKGFVDAVVIVADGAEIARHPRSYEPGDMVCDPRHYLALIETKPGANKCRNGGRLAPDSAQFNQFFTDRFAVINIPRRFTHD